MVDRIKQIMEFYKLAPAAFAEQIGINRSNLTHLFSGRNQPSLELAKKILVCYPDIKTEWLIMGVGQMFLSSDERELNIQKQKEKLMHISHSEPDLFNTYEPLSSLSKSVVNTKNTPKKEILDVEKETTTIEKEIPLPSLPVSSVVPEIKQIVFFYTDKSFEVFHTGQNH